MHDFSKCPRCGAPTVPAIAYNNLPSEYFLECTKCNTYINTYMPQPHQAAVAEDPHTYIGNFGAYGTGKTLTSREELLKHIFLTPDCNCLVGANVMSQYEQTIKREFEADIPKAFVAGYSTMKSYMDFINGGRVMYRPLDDPDKLRSYNLSFFVIVEGSEVDGESFQQLKTRLRNLAAAIQARKEDGTPIFKTLENGMQVPVIKVAWNKGIVESNPDSGWIRTDILHCSDVIHRHGRVMDDTIVAELYKDKAISSHVASTDINAFLPEDFIANNCKNKPQWWINRYIFSSFSYAEGLVYPAAGNCVVPEFQIPPKWKRIVAADYGLADDFVYLCGAIDEREGILYIYREVRVNNKDIEALAKLYFDATDDIPMGGLYTAPILDPKSGAKRDYNKKSLYDHFLDYGIAFQPGHVNVAARVFRTNTYFQSGKLRIMDCCAGLIGELNDYKFPHKKLTGNTKAQDKPVDKNNHAINPLEWICMALPKDPKDLFYGAYDMYGNDLTKEDAVKNMNIPWALQDDLADYREPIHSMYEGGNIWD